MKKVLGNVLFGLVALVLGAIYATPMLVEHAGVTMDELLRFLGLESDSEVSAAVARIQDRTTGSYHARRQVRHFVENHERRVGRYRENLGKEQLAGVLEVCGDLLARLGYD